MSGNGLTAAVVLLLYNAPIPLYPEPFRITGSAEVWDRPLRSNVAPELTVVEPVVLPSELITEHFKIPASTTIFPVAVKSAVNVMVLFPFFVKVELPE